jgi:hypothetical protein
VVVRCLVDDNWETLIEVGFIVVEAIAVFAIVLIVHFRRLHFGRKLYFLDHHGNHFRLLNGEDLEFERTGLFQISIEKFEFLKEDGEVVIRVFKVVLDEFSAFLLGLLDLLFRILGLAHTGGLREPTGEHGHIIGLLTQTCLGVLRVHSVGIEDESIV